MSLPHSSFADEYRIVLNAQNATKDISKLFIKKIFFGGKTLWDGKERIRVGYVDVESPVANDFFETVIGMKRSKFKRYWRRKLFSGSGVPPRKFKSKKELISFVEDNPASIGVVFSVIQNEAVKIISLEKLEKH